MIDLSPAQATPLIAKLLASPESRSLDLKRVSGKMTHKVLETLCAFANTEGGALALGVEDRAKAQGAARLFGIQENAEALDELQRKVRTQFNPPIDDIRFLLRLPCTLRDGSAGHVVMVQVPRSDKVHSIVTTAPGRGSKQATGRCWRKKSPSCRTGAACAAPRASRCPCRWSCWRPMHGAVSCKAGA